ncbi:MAG TPA: glycosyltransferase family 9 protein [Chloroflexota bacterium]|nr:glycosyltransferase family 9 protein [Chloroflexota bacterium]
MDRRWQDAKRILVVRLDNLGDVLLATPAFRAIRRARPAASITLFAGPAGAPVKGLIPDLDDVVVHRAPWMDPDHALSQEPAREQEIIATIRDGHYDGAIIFTSYHQSALPAAYLCYLAGVPLRHAASIDGPGSLLTSRHHPPDRVMHEVERGLDLVGGLGIPPAEDTLVLRPRDADRQAMRGYVGSVRRARCPVVAIHPGCTCPTRTYPPELFARAAAALETELGARILWTGSSAERNLVEEIRSSARAAGAPDGGISLAGQTDLSRLAALLGAADVVVTNNTGPMHVAAAMGTPVAALFALTNPPEEWHPWKVPHRLLNHDVPCRLCYRRVCPFGHECLRLVTADEVVAAVRGLLAETSEREQSA